MYVYKRINIVYVYIYKGTLEGHYDKIGAVIRIRFGKFINFQSNFQSSICSH